MIKINLYGDGVRIWLCHLEDELFSEMNKTRKHLPWESVLFDFDFLNHFGFDHWSELSPLKAQMGFYLYEKNLIEIKQGNRRLSRFSAKDLRDNNTLFPLYRAVDFKFENLILPLFMILEYETGMIMRYAIETDKIVMDDLTFQLGSLQGDLVLSGISHKSQQLTIRKTDTVVRGMAVVWDLEKGKD